MKQEPKEILYKQGWYLKQLDPENENVQNAFKLNRKLLGIDEGLEKDDNEQDEEEIEPDVIGIPAGENDLKIVDDVIDFSVPEPVKGGSEMKTRRLLVIHFTAGASAISSIDFWRATRKASAHIVIAREGSIIQCRPFNKTAGHAGPKGKSRWVDPNTGRMHDGLNSCSIGIELANGGNSYPERFSSLEPVIAKHKNGGATCKWERYTAEQIAAVKKVSKLLVEYYNLDDVIGHEDCSPERKTDPGPAFPMKELREYCGFSGLPKVHWKK